MTAPTVIAALAIAGKGAPKITGGKGGDIVREAQLFHRALKRQQALTQFGQQVRMRADSRIGRTRRLVCMQVIAAHPTEEDLSFHTKSSVGYRTVAGFD